MPILKLWIWAVFPSNSLQFCKLLKINVLLSKLELVAGITCNASFYHRKMNLISMLLVQLTPFVTSNSFVNEWKNVHLKFDGVDQCVFKIKFFFKINFASTIYSIPKMTLSYPHKTWGGISTLFEACAINFIVKYDFTTDQLRRKEYIFDQRDPGSNAC